MRSARRLSGLGQGSDISSLVNDLLGMQSSVQQYAPQLASQWGWLAAQGKAIVSGSGAKITSAQWVAQYRSFYGALQNAEPGQLSMTAGNFNTAIGNDASQGFPEAEGTVLQTADTVANAPGAVANAFSGIGTALEPYLPWIIGAVVLAITLPAVIRAFDE
jgi:hypothetical protein